MTVCHIVFLTLSRSRGGEKSGQTLKGRSLSYKKYVGQSLAYDPMFCMT